jgi:hypothetical protein
VPHVLEYFQHVRVTTALGMGVVCGLSSHDFELSVLT